MSPRTLAIKTTHDVRRTTLHLHDRPAGQYLPQYLPTKVCVRPFIRISQPKSA